MVARGLNVAAASWVERSNDCHDEYTKGRILRLQQYGHGPPQSVHRKEER